LERASYTCPFGREKYVLSNFCTCSDTSCTQWRGEKKLKTKQSEECVSISHQGTTPPLTYIRIFNRTLSILSESLFDTIEKKTEILFREIDFVITVIPSRISLPYGYRIERVAVFSPGHVSCDTSIL
jgi:hypothetical protein